jgi:hypothetical protein
MNVTHQNYSSENCYTIYKKTLHLAAVHLAQLLIDETGTIHLI